MTTRIDEIATKTNGRRAALGLALALTLAGCQNGGGKAPTLQALTIAAGPAYLAVGASRQLTATGRYSDGTTAAVASGLRWQSSDLQVATVDQTGLVSAIGKGNATITATHAAGPSATADVVSRVVVSLALGAADLPRAGTVDTTLALYRITGLTPGAFYTPTLSKLEDDVDLEVFSDLSLSPDAQACASQTAGTVSEACTAPATSAGELYVAVDGSWTEDGSSFQLDTASAVPLPHLAVGFPGQLPLAGTVDRGEVAYRVTGLTPGAAYVVRISGLTDDADLDVYSDPYHYGTACSSYASGKVDDFCTAAANAAGELFAEIDGESTVSGAGFTLTVAAAR